MTNGAEDPRGVIKVKLGEYELRARGTWGAIAEIEAETGIGAVWLARLIEINQAKLTDILKVLTAGFRAADAGANFAKVQQIAENSSIAEMRLGALQIMREALMAGRAADPPGKATAATETAESTGAAH